MKRALFVVLILCAFGSYAAAPLTFQVNGSKPQFEVTLASNPTTGYQWTVTSFDKNRFKLTGSHYVAPKTRLIGQGGKMTFTFALINGKNYPTTTQMLFNYSRPWEANKGSPQQVTLQFLSR